MRVKVKGYDVDVIEIFDGYALVQRIIDGNLFVIEFCELTEYNSDEEPSPEVQSNIISIEEFRKCSRKTKTRKRKLM